MKVLVVGPDRSDPGGVANYYNAVFPRLSDESVDARYLEVGSTKGKGGVAHIIVDQVRFWKMLSKFRPDLVHLNPSLVPKSFFRDGLFIFLAKLRRRPVLVFFRGWDSSFETRISGMLGRFFAFTYGKADAFVVLAKAFSESLKRWGVSAPIFIGSTTVEDDLLREFSIDRKVGSIQEAKVLHLLYLARLERGKGVLELVGAVKNLLDKRVPVSLTIAGDGPIVKEIRALIGESARYRDSVRLVGYVRGDEKVDVFRSHHIYCFPTRYAEGMPNSVLEAMAFGLPVVTCPVGGIADFFENGKMGELLTKTDPDAIANSILSLLSDRVKLSEMARYNYCYAQQRFLASTAAEMLRRRYTDLLTT